MDYKQRIREVVFQEDGFISMSFGTGRGGKLRKVVVRPVMIKNRRLMQFSYFDSHKDITKNYDDDEARQRLDEVLEMPFGAIQVHTASGGFQVQITKKGQVIFHESPHKTPTTPDLQHDRRKQLVLPARQPNPYLIAVGIMTQDGKIKAGMQDKFAQINEFLKLVSHSDDFQRLAQSGDSLYVVDCGCGSAYLTFAMYHYLNHVLNIPARLTGIDIKGALLGAHAAKVLALNWDGLDFQQSSIIGFTPESAPDVVLALHACDTATDEALAQAIRWQSRLIFSAPCCHQHLQAQLGRQPTPLPFAPVLRHGILRQRLGDILTDSLRALILRIMGYKAEVIEFVSAEHTGKNLMIRAAKTALPGQQRFVDEYLALKQFWGVTPYLETLLADDLTRFWAG